MGNDKISQDEIIEMARQAGLIFHALGNTPAELEAFAKLVAAKEREACADNVETFFDPMWADHYDAGNQLAKMIRARGEA